MRKSKKRNEVCSACKHEFDCTYPTNAGVTALQCDEFETGAATTVRGNGRKTKAAAGNLRVEATIAGKGLCSNCENYASCAYPKPEGGVWHCEEYQ